MIPYAYEEAWYFREGLAPVRQGNQWGYIDSSGRWVIPCQFDSAELFSEGKAPVKFGNEWGYINRLGQPVFPYALQMAMQKPLSDIPGGE